MKATLKATSLAAPGLKRARLTFNSKGIVAATHRDAVSRRRLGT